MGELGVDYLLQREDSIQGFSSADSPNIYLIFLPLLNIVYITFNINRKTGCSLQKFTSQ